MANVMGRSAPSVRESWGFRVLVVEDSYMAAQAIGSMLSELGATVLGPVPTVKEAMTLLDDAGVGGCDGAILDINLGSETSEGVAWRLDRAGIPFFFVSGYQSPRAMLKNENFRGRRLIAKPIEAGPLREAVAEEFGGRESSHR